MKKVILTLVAVAMFAGMTSCTCCQKSEETCACDCTCDCTEQCDSCTCCQADTTVAVEEVVAE